MTNETDTDTEDEAATEDIGLVWVDHGQNDHHLLFGTLEVSVHFPADNMTVISVIARDADGDDPIPVMEQFYAAKVELETAKAHALKLADAWLRANLEALCTARAALEGEVVRL